MTTTPCKSRYTGPLSGSTFACVFVAGHDFPHESEGSGMLWTDRFADNLEDEVSPAFTQAEVGILLTCLQPVTQFFPELVKKLEGMK